MKVLYAIQGTGNGHVARARDVVPALKKIANVDVLISGIQSDIDVDFNIDYRFKGMSFIFGKRGGVDLFRSLKVTDLGNLRREIKNLPVEKYDLVINDFEPVSAWACKNKSVNCVQMSHQAAVLSPNAPRPKFTDPVGKSLLKYYAPSVKKYGFHFQSYDQNIYTPVIRKQIRELEPMDKGHITVYLPAYEDKSLINFFNLIPEVEWEVFSKHNKAAIQNRNVKIRPVDNEGFIQSMTNSHGVFCGAGFETPAEALFLKKKVFVVPMRNQYEQHCNAASLNAMGVPVIRKLDIKHLTKVRKWIMSDHKVEVDYPDETDRICEEIIKENQP